MAQHSTGYTIVFSAIVCVVCGIGVASGDNTAIRSIISSWAEAMRTDVNLAGVLGVGAHRDNWGIKGAWYCYSDGSDSGTSCKGSDGKGTGAIPWNTTSSAMCMSGTMGTGSGKYAGIGFKVNSGPPGDMTAAGTWDGSKTVGFAITLTSGSSG